MTVVIEAAELSILPVTVAGDTVNAVVKLTVSSRLPSGMPDNLSVKVTIYGFRHSNHHTIKYKLASKSFNIPIISPGPNMTIEIPLPIQFKFKYPGKYLVRGDVE